MPSLIVVRGLPGTGKTRIAKALAEKLRATYLSSDVIRKQLLQKPNYSAKEKERVYDCLLSKAEEILAGGNGVRKHGAFRVKHLSKAERAAGSASQVVVVDATFSKVKWLQRFKALANHLGINFVLIETFCDKCTALKRVSRPRAFTDANEAVYFKLCNEFQPTGLKRLRLDTGKSFQESLRKAIAYTKVEKRQ